MKQASSSGNTYLKRIESKFATEKPFHAKKMLFCNKTQETFKNLNIFTKWLKEKSGLDISVNDTIKVVAGIDKEIHGYDICYAP